MSDSLGWAPRAATHRSSGSGSSLGSAAARSNAKEYTAPEDMMRICGKCRNAKLSSLNPGPCEVCKKRYGRRISRTKNWCMLVPKGTPLPVPEEQSTL